MQIKNYCSFSNVGVLDTNTSRVHEKHNSVFLRPVCMNLSDADL